MFPFHKHPPLIYILQQMGTLLNGCGNFIPLSSP
jgi:4-amino-4-deoxy-L-arabinose transferase-like glycosyltransferase